VVAQFNHPGQNYDGAFAGFPFDAQAVPAVALQEIGNNARDYVTYEAAFVQNNFAGWRVAPTINSDTHQANWGRGAAMRTGVVAAALTPADLLAAMQARRVFATEDANLALALRSGPSWMGQVISPTAALPLTIFYTDAEAEAADITLFDNNLPVAQAAGGLTATVAARPGHFLWAKAVQADGEAAYTAPLWVAGRLEPEPLQISELLPAPGDWDWDNNGAADYHDEWVELHNPLDRPVGLGGWQLADASGYAHRFPLGAVIPPYGYMAFMQAQTGLSLNNDGDTLTLIHPGGTVVDTFSYAASPGYDESWCRLAQGRWSSDCGPSPHAPNWEKAPPGPLAVSVYNAKRLSYNAWVRVKGWVTAPPGLLGSRRMYLQDDSAGIAVYLPKEYNTQLKLGDRVEVEGNLRSFYEEQQIVVSKARYVSLLEPGSPPPPLPIATTSLLEPYEGRLVLLQGQAAGFKGASTFWVDDGTGPAKVYITRSTGIKKPYLAGGAPITVVGIVSQYSSKDNPTRADYRLLLRYPTDLAAPAPPAAPGNWPVLLPETGF
jgi:uncharacterized protein YdeI (BOF family)